MNEALGDEVLSINSIYGEDTLVPSEGTNNDFTLKIQGLPVSLHVIFPDDYPSEQAQIVGPAASDSTTKKGEANEVADLARSVLRDVYVKEEPCMFELIEGLMSRYKEKHEDAANVSDDETPGQTPKNQASHQDTLPLKYMIDPGWTLSEPITEKKSVFIARAAPVTSPKQVHEHVQHLLLTDKKAAKATHNITAWRIRDASDGASNVVFQDCDDDGETAAGGRLLHLLQLMDVWNVLVIVTRWYGGVQLGPDRFRIINSVARDAVVKSGLAGAVDSKEGGKKSKG